MPFAAMPDSEVASAFKRPLFQDVSRLFFFAFLGAILFEASIVFVMARRPADVYSDKEIARIQERFAQFILADEFPNKAVESAIGVGGGSGTGAGSGGETEGEVESGEVEDSQVDGGEPVADAMAVRRAGRVSSEEAIRQGRERIQQEVSGKGLLGLLTGTGNAAEGQAVASIFSNGRKGGGSSDLDELLGSVTGLKTQGGSGLSGEGGGGEGLGGVKGGRTGSQATIDDLVTDRGSAQSETLERKGDLHLESPADIKGRGSLSANRSAEAIHTVLVGHVKAVQYCYERELKRSPSLKGKVTVRITIAPDGSVKNAEIISSTLDNPRVERCILSRIQLWKDFSAIEDAEGDVSFRQVYTFGY
jgi:TonB family protein